MSGGSAATHTTEAGVIDDSGSVARQCPPPPAYPTPDCTGVPPGTVFTRTVTGDYFVKTQGEQLDAWHVTGTVVIQASDIVIRNSQIDGQINNEYSGVFSGPFTVVDSTIGTDSTCQTAPAVGASDYTAIRLHIHGFEDGFAAAGPNVTVRDCYVKQCGTPTSAADGIGDYPATANLVFDHNTVDECGAWTLDRSKPCDITGHNSPIHINSRPADGPGYGSRDVTITRNLVMGGVYSVFIWPAYGTWIISGNRVVDGTWDYGSYETNGQCDHVTTWSDNAIVTMDSGYNVTSVLRTEPCPP
jgi:hypothetical protein